MPELTQSSPILRFDAYLVNLRAGELFKDGRKVNLQEQPFQILAMLLERPGDVVTREELRQRLWSDDTFVDFEHSLNTAIKKLRRALNDEADKPRYIETLRQRGYRFIGRVDGGNGSGPAALTEQKPGAGEKSAVRSGIGASPAAASSPETGAARWNTSGRKLWATGLVGLCALSAAGFYWFSNASSIRPPSVLHYRQLTTDRQIKGENPCGGGNDIFTDGPRIFFSEPSSALAEVSSNGGDVVRVPTPIACSVFFDISPDKTELLASSNIDSFAPNQPLWSLSVANVQAHRLGDLLGHAAAWSPDGQRIAYAKDDNASRASDLYIAAKDGSDPQKLIRIDSGFVQVIRWSPDGKVLRMLVWNERSNALWQMSADGTNLQRMDLFSGEPRPIADINWTLDGKYFLFSVGRNNTYSPFVNLGSDIWAIREAKSLLPKKTAKPIQLTTGAMSFWAPTPSPDGKQIFAAGGQIRGELARYDLKSGKLEPYLSGISAEQLDFSKDGKWLTYVTFPEGILWRSRVDGEERSQLTNPPLTANLPRWSPDGTRIAFSGVLPGGFWKTYVIPAEGGKPEVVSQGERFELDPTWSEDGTSLVFGAYMTALYARIYSVNLKTGRESIVAGSDGMYSPRVSPDNRFIVALDSPGDRRLLLFDQGTQKWSELMSQKNPGLSWPQWSSDSKSVYVMDFADRHAPVVYRINIADRKTERLAAFEVPQGITGYWVGWAGLAPDGSPLVLRDLSIEEIYALDVDLP